MLVLGLTALLTNPPRSKKGHHLLQQFSRPIPRMILRLGLDQEFGPYAAGQRTMVGESVAEAIPWVTDLSMSGQAICSHSD